MTPDPDPLLQLTAGPDGVGPLLRVAGELDTLNADQLHHRGRQLIASRPAAVTLELSGLRFCDAAGLNTLLMLRAAADAAAVRLVLRHPTAQLRRLLRITGLTHLIHAKRGADPNPPIA